MATRRIDDIHQLEKPYSRAPAAINSDDWPALRAFSAESTAVDGLPIHYQPYRYACRFTEHFSRPKPISRV